MVAESPEGPGPGGGVALVLSGAGARGAYEAGALSVLLPVLADRDRPRIIVGTSAGALNAAMLASVIDQGPVAAANALVEGWRSISPKKVFATPRRGAWTAVAWHLRHRPRTAAGLLDTKPLERTIAEIVGRPDFGHNVVSGHLDGIGIAASSCSTAQAVVFVESGGAPPPSGGRVRYVGTKLDYQHLLASSAFPIAFPPKWVEGKGYPGDWYIDGGLHLNTPLKPAIDLGADRLLVLGGTPARPSIRPSPDVPPNATDENGQILHALLMDQLETDLAQLASINRYLVTPGAGGSRAHQPPRHRSITTFVMNPSGDDLDRVAAKIWPAGWKSLLQSLGGYPLLGGVTPQRQQPGQFLSYLCFHPDFIRAALCQGEADARAKLGAATSIPWA